MIRLKPSPNRLATCVAAAALALGIAGCDKQQQKTPVSESSSPMTQSEGPGSPSSPPNTAADAGAKSDQAQSPAAGGPAAGGIGNMAQSPADGELAAKVQAALTKEPALKSQSITVQAAAGVVTLSGVTNSEANRDQAEKVALTVDGVKNVENKLAIVRSS